MFSARRFVTSYLFLKLITLALLCIPTAARQTDAGSRLTSVRALPPAQITRNLSPG
jgi:hypothetical protein